LNSATRKATKRLSLLSGGEKSMTALAFLFAVFLARPCPFYILDEVEAALDDLNIDRFLALLRQYSSRAQFIVVTHQKRTMEAAEAAADAEEDQPDMSEPGVEIEVTPAGKATKRLSLMSGGEKSLVALAFLFAVFLARPCPFYILDEVEAALDDANIDRFLQLVRQFSDRAQFIVVTHQKRTMDAADCLYGVSMGGNGVSKVVSRKLPRELVNAAETERAA
jgi:chromosome segregation ATPase